MASPSIPYLGSKIRLISKIGIRYEGILSNVDTTTSTVVVKDVRMFGTEGRREGNQIPPIDKVFDVISFKGSDIRELTVCETPSPAPSTTAPAPTQTTPSATTTTANVPNTTATATTTTTSQPSVAQPTFGTISTPSTTDQSKGTTSTQQQLPPSMQNMPPFAQQPFLNNPFVSPFQQFGPYGMPFNPYFPNFPMQNFGPFASQANVPPTSAPTNIAPFTTTTTTAVPPSTTTSTTAAKVPIVTPSTLETKAATVAPAATTTPATTAPSVPKTTSAHVEAPSTKSETAITNGTAKPQQESAAVATTDDHKTVNKGGRGGHRGRGGYTRGGHRGQPTKTFKEQMEEFDFQTSNAQFDKEALKKEVEPPADSKFYDKTSSFFDTISRDANKETARTKQERDDQYKLDVETFGSNTVNQIRNQHRFHHRGRGGNFRGGNRGGRGNYRNTNYRNTNKQEQQ